MSFDPSNIDVIDFLDCLEMRNVTQATADEVRFSCPFPNHANGDENASAYMNIETTAFYCHGCKEKGNAITFTAAYLGVSPIEATRLLRERYQPGYLNPDARNTVEEIRKILAEKEEGELPLPVLSEESVQQFEVDWFAVDDAMKSGRDVPPELTYMIDRGFDAETLSEWQFGFDPRSDRVVFPVRDAEGRIVGFKGRAWYERHPKYLVIGDRPGREPRYGWPTYPTGKVVFGLHRAVRMADPDLRDSPRNLIVCEGELNAIALQMNGWPGVAVNGSNFTEAQANLLRREADSVTVFFDSLKRNDEGELVPDQAGRDGTKKVVDALEPFLPVKIVPEHEGDPADLEPSVVDELIENSVGSTLARIF